MGLDFVDEHLDICHDLFHTHHEALAFYHVIRDCDLPAVSAGDRNPTMDYLNHTCGVAFRDASDLSERVRPHEAQNAISVHVRVLRNSVVSYPGVTAKLGRVRKSHFGLHEVGRTRTGRTHPGSTPHKCGLGNP